MYDNLYNSMEVSAKANQCVRNIMKKHSAFIRKDGKLDKLQKMIMAENKQKENDRKDMNLMKARISNYKRECYKKCEKISVLQRIIDGDKEDRNKFVELEKKFQEEIKSITESMRYGPNVALSIAIAENVNVKEECEFIWKLYSDLKKMCTVNIAGTASNGGGNNKDQQQKPEIRADGIGGARSNGGGNVAGPFKNEVFRYPKFVAQRYKHVTPGGGGTLNDDDCKDDGEVYDNFDGQTLNKLRGLLMAGVDKFGAWVYFCDLLRLDGMVKFEVTCGMLANMEDRFHLWDFRNDWKAKQQYLYLKDIRNYIMHNDEGNNANDKRKKWMDQGRDIPREWKLYQKAMKYLIKYDEKVNCKEFVWNERRNNGFVQIDRRKYGRFHSI